MLRQRLTLGPVFIAVIFLVSWLDERIARTPLPQSLADLLPDRTTFPPGVALFVTLATLVTLCALELAAIFRANNIAASRWLTCSAGLFGLAMSSAAPAAMPAGSWAPVAATATILVMVLALVYHSRHHTVEGVVAAAGGALFSYVYLGLIFGFMLDIRRGHSMWVVLGVVLITKACDTGAYFTGRAIGRHKLIPWLSPGKTWEGLAGGVLTAVAAGIGAAALSRLGGERFTFTQGVVAGVLFGLVGQAGDLAASLLKRDAGIKDSSHALPGFGGFIDVIDSPLLVAPVAYWMLVAWGPAG